MWIVVQVVQRDQDSHELSTESWKVLRMPEDQFGCSLLQIDKIPFFYNISFVLPACGLLTNDANVMMNIFRL